MAISIGDALLKIGVDTRDLDKGMQGIGNSIKKHQKAIGLGMVAAGGAILAAGALSIKTFAEMGDEVQKMALRTGFSTEALSELRHAAEISGASLTTLEKAVKRMSGTILDAQDGLETYIRAFQHIGIEVEELDGLNPEQQFLKIAEAIAEVEDPTKRAALAQDIFGRAGTELLPLFASGKEGLADLREEAHKLGIVFDQEAANKAAEFTDAMHRVDEAASGLKMQIAENLIPILLPLIDKVKDLVSNFTAWAKEHPKLTKVLVIGTAAFGGLLIVLGTLLLLMPGLTAATTAFGISLNLAIWPITLVAVAIAALIAIGILLWKNWDKVVYFFKIAWANIKIYFLQGVESVLATLEKFTSFIPILGDKVREAREAISNMIEAEKIEKDVIRVKKALEDTTSAWEDYIGAIEDTSEAIDPDYIEALQKEQEELENTRIALEDQKKAYENLIDKAEDAVKQFQYERSEAGKLRITTRDVTNALIEQGMTAEELADLWERLGDDVNYADRYLEAVGLTSRDIIEILGLQKDAVDRLGDSYVELGNKAVDMQGEISKGIRGAAAEALAAGGWSPEVSGAGAAIISPAGYVDFIERGTVGTYEERLRWVIYQLRSALVPAGYIASYFPRLAAFLEAQGVGFQRGGIAMRPMLAQVAERAPEAIIPLDRLEGMLGSREVNIYVELDGRVIARAIGQPLVDEIRLKTGMHI